MASNRAGGRPRRGSSRQPAGRSAGRGTRARTRQRVSSPDLARSIKRVMAARGLTTRDVVGKLPSRHVGTAYRLLAGRTRDPWTSTMAAMCAALDAEPNELLGVHDATADLEPEIRQVFDDVSKLPVEDRWLVLDVLRAVLRRRRADK